MPMTDSPVPPALHRTLARIATLAGVAVAVSVTAAPPPDTPPAAPPSCDYGAAHAESPPEMTQFAFLVGDYRITLHAWQGDRWSPPQPGVTARWNGRYGLGGRVIVDEWFNPDPAQNPRGQAGINVRLYDSDTRAWKMMWIATGARTVQELRAEVIDDVLTMWQISPERPDFKATFTVHDADHWDRVSYTTDPDGAWVRQFRLSATRIPCH